MNAIAKTYAAAAGFLLCILAANYVTTEYGMVPVGFGLTATAGTYFAGLTFVLRDSIQDGGGKRLTFALIVFGAVLSYILAVTLFPADPRFLPPSVTGASIAVASGLAFLCSETADLCIYSPLRERGYLRAAVASNVVGAFVDTVLFLWVAGFPVWSGLPGQMVGKTLISLAAALAVAVVRTRRAVMA